LLQSLTYRVGFGHPDNYRDPVRPFLIVEERDPLKNKKY
jgi:hypothetical protein